MFDSLHSRISRAQLADDDTNWMLQFTYFGIEMKTWLADSERIIDEIAGEIKATETQLSIIAREWVRMSVTDESLEAFLKQRVSKKPTATLLTYTLRRLVCMALVRATTDYDGDDAPDVMTVLRSAPLIGKHMIAKQSAVATTLATNISRLVPPGIEAYKKATEVFSTLAGTHIADISVWLPMLIQRYASSHKQLQGLFSHIDTRIKKVRGKTGTQLKEKYHVWLANQELLERGLAAIARALASLCFDAIFGQMLFTADAVRTLSRRSSPVQRELIIKARAMDTMRKTSVRGACESIIQTFARGGRGDSERANELLAMLTAVKVNEDEVARLLAVEAKQTTKNRSTKTNKT